MKKKVTSILSFVIAGTMLLTSCDALSGSKEKDKKKKGDLNEDIVDCVEGYFKKITDMSFSKLDKFVEDSAWSDLDLKSDEFDVLNAYLGRVEIEVTETDGDDDDDEGSATFTMTYVDLGEIIDGLDSDADLDDIIEALEDKKAETTEEEIEIDLTNDDGWMIDDDSDIYDTLMEDMDDLFDMVAVEATTTTTTEATTDATTTTTQDTTTATTTAPNDPAPVVTQPQPSKVAPHIVDTDTFIKLCEEMNLEAEDNSSGDIIMKMYNDAAEEFMVLYIYSDNLADYESELDGLIEELLYEDICIQDGSVTDEWAGNTHHIMSENNSYFDGDNLDIYLYRDDNSLALIVCDQVPQADFGIAYYELIQKFGIYDFGFDV